MKRILVLASFPAPYRVAVFQGLSNYYKLDVFFGTSKDQNRSKSYFVDKDSFKYYLIDDKEDQDYFKLCVSNLEQYDLVLAYDWYLNYALKVERKCIKKGIPYIINCDGAFVPETLTVKDHIKRIVKGYFIKRATLCFGGGISAERYFEYYGAKEARIKLHPFSSLHKDDILEKALTDTEKSKWKERLGLSTSKMVLAIGQFIRRKGFDILLEAWTELDEQYQLVLIGGGDKKQEYDAIIENKKYRNVKLIDFLPKDKVFEYYMAADVFVMPTREDVWGLVINEAMATGLPVISSNRCNAAVELVKNGENGYIVPNEDSESLAERIQFILRLDETQRMEMQNESIMCISEYTLERIIEKHVADINAVLYGQEG